MTVLVPNGAEAWVEIQTGDVVGCSTTGGIAIGQPHADKGAYEMYAVLARYKAGPRTRRRKQRRFCQVPQQSELPARSG